MIAIIGTVGVPACYGGFETLVENLLGNGDEELLVYCSGKTYETRQERFKNARLIYIPLHANGVQSIPYDMWSICDAVRRGATDILVLGVSGSPMIPLIRLFKDVNFVTNIDGLEWRRDKWGRAARWYLKFAEKIAVRHSHTVVADNQAIADYVVQEYGVNSEVIAYGGDHALNGHALENTEQGAEDYGFALCRIEPENNVDMILKAFAGTTQALKFVGNWDASDYGRRLKKKYAESPNIDIIDPIYDLDILFGLRKGCSFYVHGHSAGGTNPSLVEMMHFAKPIFCFDCNYNRASTENAADYFATAAELAPLIEQELLQENRMSRGRAMQEIASRRYTWNIVKSQYKKLLN